MGLAEPVSTAQVPKKSLPERIRRDLKTGETIYHSTAACHVSAKHPEGKWIAQVRREERGRLVKYPVKGFANPSDALTYIKSLRPDEKGRVHAPIQSEATVQQLYEYARKHTWKSIGSKRRAMKESRWRLHLAPYWGHVPLSQVTRRAVQEWITDVEEKIGSEGYSMGHPQLAQCRFDMHGLFEVVGLFDERYEDRRNPFRAKGLACVPCEQRDRVCIESQYFSALECACRRLAEENLVTDWIVAMFLTSLFSGLRLGEVLVLCREQIDFKNGIIRVDRAVREKDRELDPLTMWPVGPVRRVAINLPKGNKVRLVPMCDQLAAILRPYVNQRRSEGAVWDLIFPSESGYLKEERRVQLAFGTLKKRLHELATHAELGGRGWQRNPITDEFRDMSLPAVWTTIVYRDTRNSFASYAEEVGVPQATREAILGHGPKGVTNKAYTDVTSRGLQEARKRLTKGWRSRVGKP